MASDVTVGAVRQSATAPELSLGLAGSLVRSRYRVNAVSSVNRDVVVYSAEDVQHGRSIALKALRDELARDAQFVAAVRAQAGALATAAHVLRGVQRVYEFGVTETGQFFVALEWAEGATLREVLDAGGALAVPTALRVAIRIGEALEALHHSRLLHGQLGSDSVLMVNDGERIRLVGAELAAAYRTPIGTRLQDTFSLAYRAPEQLERGETTEATDVYALGMLLRQLLTAGKAGQATPAQSPTLQRIITTALQARPEHRYPDISVMVNDIWGATAVLAEPQSRPRSVKARGNPRRRVRRRRRRFTLRITAAVATAGVIAAVVWLTGFDRIISHLQGRVTLPAVTAVPVEPNARPSSDVPLSAEAPSSSSATHELPPPPPESRPIADTSTGGRRAPAVAKPVAAPAVVRQPQPAPSVIGSRPRSTVESRPANVVESRSAAVESRPAAVESRRAAVESRAPAQSRAPAEMSATVARRTAPERPARTEWSEVDAGDGSAVIDWLLKDRR